MISRRRFLKQTTVLGAGATLGARAMAFADSPNEKIVVGIMGVNGRGMDLCRGFSAQKNVEFAYVCDVDERALARATAALTRAQGKAPQGVRDFRRILDDPDVDALLIAAPDHWHAPAAILACDAGKHVYVEKPASHNAREGELLVAAARKHGRTVQLGTQRRSMPGVREAVERLRAGAIGPVRFARGWYNNTRKSIGHGKSAPVPEWLDYDLWQGPAPERPYQDNLIHYNWHWFWHWGTGELGNNGIHALDVCRWGLGVEYPTRVTAGGGLYALGGDQQTPDTCVTTYDFGDKGITWEGRSWHPRGFEGSDFGAAFYGDGGTLVLDGGGYHVLDLKGKEVAKVAGSSSDAPHFQNFLECVRGGNRLNAEIEEGHKSTLLCHLGNIAWRTGRTLHCDSGTGHVLGDRKAMALWGREYRKGWEPRV
jgi:predicted dehydrogenase